MGGMNAVENLKCLDESSRNLWYLFESVRCFGHRNVDVAYQRQSTFLKLLLP